MQHMQTLKKNSFKTLHTKIIPSLLRHMPLGIFFPHQEEKLKGSILQSSFSIDKENKKTTKTKTKIKDGHHILMRSKCQLAYCFQGETY